MTTLRSLAVALLLAFATAGLPAHATTYSTDYTDLWYNSPAESEAGWGVNIIQQGNILFVTLFVYGPDGTPRWYVGSNIVGTSQTTFTGDIYSTGGTYFGTPWAAANFNFRKVGTILFTFNANNTAAMSYNVDNVVVTKNIVRQSWRFDVLTGAYVGGTAATGPAGACSSGVLISGFLNVNHTDPTVSMYVDFVAGNGQSGRCNYAGTYSQVGRVGAINNGTYNCTIGGAANALVGTFTVSEITTSRNGFNGHIDGTMTAQACSYSGSFGGIKDNF